jgi:hypothetical protein
MSLRPLDTATSAAFQQSDLPIAFIIYLDILSDPLLTWTGIGDLTFGSGATGDVMLDGNTFIGSGNVIEIGTATDAVGGSDVFTLSLPGVDITMPILRQTIYNRNHWQFRRAYVWMMVLDPTTYAIVGKPFRIKTGRMDQMPYTETDKGGIVSCKIEGQQAYGKQALMTRYSEQLDLNSSDNSQNFIYSLANMTAAMGTPSASPSALAPYSAINGFNFDSYVP